MIAIAFSPSDITGETPVLLASGSYDRTIKLWDVYTGQSAKHAGRIGEREKGKGNRSAERLRPERSRWVTAKPHR